MKKSVKIISIVIALVIVMTAVFTGCGDTKDKSIKRVGIIQFMPHNSLDNCTQGVKNALDKAGITYDVQIGSTASAVDDCQTYASNMIASGKYDLIVAVATPAATAAYSAVRSAGANIPVIFCAVSAPVEAGLVKSLEVPENNCTGTKDALDFPAQLSLIKALQPELTKLGVFYTTTEPNSIAQLKVLEAEANKLGIELKTKGINDPAELPAAVAALLPEVQAVTNLTDNNVVDNMATLLEQAKAAKKPIYGSEIEQCYRGCLASASIDYIVLGETTGNMAIDVLNGAKASEMPVKVVADSTPVINTDIATEYGIAIPEEYKTAEMVTTAK